MKVYQEGFAAGSKTRTFIIKNERGCAKKYTNQYTHQSEVYVSGTARFIAGYSYLFGALLILLGGFMCLFGTAMINLTVILVSAISFCLIETCVIYNLSELGNTYDRYAYIKGWSYLVLAIKVPAILTFIALYRHQKMHSMFLGLVTGLLQGHMIVTRVPLNNDFVYWAIIVVCALKYFILGYFYNLHMPCFFTSAIGAFAFTRGIASFLGYFPRAEQVQKYLKNGKF